MEGNVMYSCSQVYGWLTCPLRVCVESTYTSTLTNHKLTTQYLCHSIQTWQIKNFQCDLYT